jgi:hypothetical protein
LRPWVDVGAIRWTSRAVSQKRRAICEARRLWLARAMTTPGDRRAFEAWLLEMVESVWTEFTR